MSSLFIIGNGFDLAHGLPTRYEDFHSYLLHNYPDAKESPTFMIESTQLQDGSEEYDINEVVAFLIELISMAEKDGDNWCDVEKSLAYLDFESYLEEMKDFLYDENDDSIEWKMANRYEDVSYHFKKATIQIKDLFSMWINSIDINIAQPIEQFEEIIDIDNDIFLTFNYTPVLEEVYWANHVYHIHGEQECDIVFGHGEYLGEDWGTIYAGADIALMEIHDYLRKDTSKVIKEFRPVFDNLTEIDKIYSFGFSFSTVDLPYIKEVCKKLDTREVTWYLNGFDDNNTIEEFKKRLSQCGFKGEFKIY